MFKDKLNQALELQEFNAKQYKQSQEAKNTLIETILMPLYLELQEGTKGIVTPAQTRNYNDFAEAPIFKEFNNYGHCYKVSSIDVAGFSIIVEDLVAKTFNITWYNHSSKNELNNYTAEQIISHVATAVAKKLRSKEYIQK